MSKKKEIKLSATRISSFLECKYKYWCNYVEHRPKVSNPAFRLGLAVHESLELAGKIWFEKEKFSKSDKAAILKKYEEVSVREGIEDMLVHNEGKKLVQNRINDFVLGNKILSLERRFGFSDNANVSTKDGVLLMGAIDKVIEVDEDTLLIVDYKTSKTAPTSDQMKVDTQLSIYDFVASKEWPGYKRIILSFDLLRSEILYSYRTDEERADFEDYLKIIYDQMMKFTKRDAKAQLNIFCPWCDYKEYCSAYKRACKKSDYKFLSTVNMDDEKLIEEWKSVKNIKKILEERNRELSMIVMEKIKRSSVNPIVKDEEIYIRQNSRKRYNAEVISRWVPLDKLVKIVSPNNKLVEDYTKENPANRDDILKSAEVNFTTPFLAVKKIRKKKENKGNE